MVPMPCDCIVCAAFVTLSTFLAIKFLIPMLQRLCCYGGRKRPFISYLSYQLHCCALPDKRYLSHGMLPLSGHDDVALLNDVANDAESTQKMKITS